MILGAYRSLLREPGFPRLILAVNIARLPVAVIPLAQVLLIHHRTGSYLDAGAVTAAWALASGALGPLQGRLVDRLGQPRVLLPCAAVCALALGGFVIAALHDLPLGALAALSALAGASFPPLGASMRNLWKARLAGEEDRLGTAFSFESVVVELVFVAGPALCALVVALASPQAAIAGSAVAVALGTVWMATSGPSRSWPAAPSRRGIAGAMAEPGVRTLALLALPVGAVLGTLDIGLPAFARAHGHPATAGLLLTAFAVGSMAGGVWFGARSWAPERLYQRFVVVMAVFTAGLLPLAVAPSLGTMAVLGAVAGLAFAPGATCMYLLVDRVAPDGTLTEAYTWIVTATAAGQAIGVAVAGAVAQHVGAHAALLVATGDALVAVAIVVARGGMLSRDAGAPAVASDTSRRPAPTA